MARSGTRGRENGRAAPRVEPGATEQDLRDEGVAVDLPFESPDGDVEPLSYSDGSTIDEGAPWKHDPEFRKARAAAAEEDRAASD